MTSPATYFQDAAARALRETEVVGASFANGMNMGGSCSMGIGINMLEGAVVGTDEQFTLLDQQGNARDSQTSQSIGGYPYVDSDDYPSSGGTPGTEPDAAISFGDAPTQAAKDADPSLDGTISFTETSSLVTLGAGWVAFTP